MRVIGVLFLLLAAGFVLGQDRSRVGTVIGSVLDEAGAPIEKVEVVFTGRHGKRYTDTTGSGGAFQMNIPAGSYTVRAEYKEHKAWQVYIREKFEIKPGRTSEMVIELKVDPKWTDIYGTHLVGLRADKKSGVIFGVVTDELGSLVPELLVNLVGAGGADFSTKTNGAGEYFIELPAGTYTITAKFGFGFKVKEDRVEVAKGRRNKKNIILICTPSGNERCERTH